MSVEIFELNYFLAVAEVQNIHRAAEKIRVSTATLSKTIGRLEAELGVNLFEREGRRIVLTDAGRVLQSQGSEITRREEALRLLIRGGLDTRQVRVAGPEVLLNPFGTDLCDTIRGYHSETTFDIQACTDQEAIRKVRSGDAHLGLITAEPPRDLARKLLAQTKFQTCVGPQHPLFPYAKKRKSVAVAFVLQHPFATPASNLLGQIDAQQSLDGWRDDQFPRRIGYVVSGLTLLEELVASGRAVGYLPDYRVKKAGLTVLRVSGCPYTCTQKIHLITRDPEEAGWLKRLF